MEDCSNYNQSYYYDQEGLILSSIESSLSCINNGSKNATQESTEDEYLVTVAVGIILGLLILVTVVGKLKTTYPFIEFLFILLNKNLERRFLFLNIFTFLLCNDLFRWFDVTW